jgi:hypothetical protein
MGRTEGKIDEDEPHPLVELFVPEDGPLFFLRCSEVGEEEVEEGGDDESFIAVLPARRERRSGPNMKRRKDG